MRAAQHAHSADAVPASEIAAFSCAILVLKVFPIYPAARLMRRQLGGPHAILLGLGSEDWFGAIALRPRPPRAALPHKPPTPPPRAAPADYRPARPDHLPLAPPAFVLNARRPTCASSRRRFASSEITAFSCAILILRAFPILERRRG